MVLFTYLCLYSSKMYFFRSKIKFFHRNILLQLICFIVQLAFQTTYLGTHQDINRVLWGIEDKCFDDGTHEKFALETVNSTVNICYKYEKIYLQLTYLRFQFSCFTFQLIHGGTKHKCTATV